ncbi:unnamed protein product [Microthlaspi erraticum]|uniref:Retrotransposon gag domain-containing protein n=1 Tax=Microthlaspi erraticum TaxID=1685480 RepID=A0A6D2KAZ2_9BRAS|nr:unnamed protein product [Microthlaspi erraticum]
MMLFSMSLAGPALDWAQHEPLSSIESWIDFREAFLKRFVRLPPFKSKYNHYSYHLEVERDEEEWGGIQPHPEIMNEELIKHVERDPFHDSTSECAKKHLYHFEQLCNYYGLGDNPKKIQLFQLSLVGRAKEWVNFDAQHTFKTWHRYKEAFLYRFAKAPIYVPPPRPSYSRHHPSSPDINHTPLFAEESSQAVRPTKIEVMLQKYLKDQDESTKKMERRIDFIHESLGNKSEVLFKQVIKLDEDIKKLIEDHDRSLNLSKDTPSPVDPRFSPPPRSQASELPRLEVIQRPPSPTEEEDTWHYDPIDPNKISPMKFKEFNAKVKSLPFYVTFEEAWNKHDLVEFFFTTGETKEEVHKLFQKARFPMAPHAVNQPSSPPSTPQAEWYVNSISREKLAEFNQFVQTLPASMSFQQAWRHYPFTTFFHNCRETPQDRGVQFEIGDTKIPVDFHVMNIKGGCDTPWILGRPFLATAGAVMDLPNSKRKKSSKATARPRTRVEWNRVPSSIEFRVKLREKAIKAATLTS